jgi:hypothetical protein
MAEPTGLEPATSDVTGRRSNQLSYDSALETRYQIVKRTAYRHLGHSNGGRYWDRTSGPRFVRPMLSR